MPNVPACYQPGQCPSHFQVPVSHLGLGLNIALNSAWDSAF